MHAVLKTCASHRRSAQTWSALARKQLKHRKSNKAEEIAVAVGRRKRSKVGKRIYGSSTEWIEVLEALTFAAKPQTSGVRALGSFATHVLLHCSSCVPADPMDVEYEPNTLDSEEGHSRAPADLNGDSPFWST